PGFHIESVADGSPAEASQHRAVGETGAARGERSQRARLHERHEPIRKPRHRAGHAYPAHVGAAADPADPTPHRHVALHDGPLAADLYEAASMVGGGSRELPLLSEAGAPT